MTVQTHSLPFRGGFCMEVRPEPCGMIIFGASGDLSHRKLFPALFNLYLRNLLPERFFVLGCARSPFSDETFRESIKESLASDSPAHVNKVTDFLKLCYYTSLDYHCAEQFLALDKKLHLLDARFLPSCNNHIFYLATPPSLYCPIVTNLGATNLCKEKDQAKAPCVRVVVEKPFGRDLESAQSLNKALRKILAEHQIYRIDHYLGKETVQNILMLRFANTIFEPTWNRRYIDHIQITVGETLGVEHRAGYFEQAGLLRDMYQNHILQLVSLVAMEAPVSFDADRVRDEKVKLMRAIQPFSHKSIREQIVRGQYVQGKIEEKNYASYHEEKGVDRRSERETFLAVKLYIDNWRWQGVPFYLRAGKRLAKRVTEISVIFKHVPFSIFAPLPSDALLPNVLTLNIQPEEGASLLIQAKKPGPKICLAPLIMDFSYREAFGNDPPEAYERLLLDCMLGDQTLFWRQDGIEVAWSLFTPVLKGWEKQPADFLPHPYPAGSWGPKQADDLIEKDLRSWLLGAEG